MFWLCWIVAAQWSASSDIAKHPAEGPRSAAEGVAKRRDRPFGQPRLTPGIPQTDRGFTGQQSLSAAGLVDFNARWVDSSLGMFASPDSLIPNLFNPQALNRYGYVQNNPLRYTDPTGHMLSECGQFGEECGGALAPISPAPVPAKSTTSVYPTSSKTDSTQPTSLTPPITFDEDLGLCINVWDIGCSGVPGSDVEWVEWNLSMLPYEIQSHVQVEDGFTHVLFDAVQIALDYAEAHGYGSTPAISIAVDVAEQGYHDVGQSLTPGQQWLRRGVAGIEGYVTGEFATVGGLATAPFGVAVVGVVAPEAGLLSTTAGYVSGYLVGAGAVTIAMDYFWGYVNQEFIYPYLRLGAP